jgi:hypothetical protein
MRRLQFILTALVLIGCDGGGSNSTAGPAMKPFEAGQVWTYGTRMREEASRIVVCRVESDAKLGEVVHIHVKDVRLKTPGGHSDVIGHMPYAADALRKSVIALESSGATLPSFEEGYRQWRDARDKGKGGVWTIPVKEAIEGMEAAFNKK